LVLFYWHAKRPIVEHHGSNAATADRADFDSEDAVPKTGATAVDAEKLKKLNLLFRFLLPLLFVAMGVVNPYLPVALSAVGVPLSLQTMVASAWMIARLLGFVVMWRTTFWHGRYLTAVVGVFLIMVGCITVFAVPMLAGSFLPLSLSSSSSAIPISWSGLCAIVAGLFAYGVGLAAVGNSSFVYTVQAGSSHVSSTAMFEFLSSTGSIVGPVVGLGFFGLQQRGILDPALAPPLTLGVVLLFIAVLSFIGFTTALRHKPRVPSSTELHTP
jgi:MFS family permease